MDCYEELLSSLSEAIKEEPKSCRVQSGYNIFSILGVTGKEVIMCRFLTDLLNPDGEHGYGILFLKSFFRDVLKEEHINDTLLANTSVENEYEIDNKRRIDIAIHNARFFIPMEVKIDADEQPGQCYDYYEYAKKSDKNTRVVYLTEYGSVPSEYSRRDQNSDDILPLDKIKCISWEKDIYEWLTSLLGQLNEPMKSFVGQYIDTICLLTDRKGKYSVNMEKRSIEVLHRSADFFNAGLQIEKSMKAAKLRLIQLVFDDFKAEMDKIAPKYGLEMENKFNYFVAYDDLKRLEAYYDKVYTIGLNYVIKKVKFKEANFQMWFRIDIGYYLEAGMVLFDTEAEPRYGYTAGSEADSISWEMIEEAAKFLNKDIIRPSDWWFTSCFSDGKHTPDDDVPDFFSMNSIAVSLVDPEKRIEFVKKSVKIFEERLLKFLL